MDMLLYLLLGLAVGTLIGLLIGKSIGRTEWEKKSGLIRQQYGELEKEFVGYRATHEAQFDNIQQLLETKVAELTASQQAVKESQTQLAESSVLFSSAKADLRAVNQLLQDKQKDVEVVKEELRLIKHELSTSSQRTRPKSLKTALSPVAPASCFRSRIFEGFTSR